MFVGSSRGKRYSTTLPPGDWGRQDPDRRANPRPGSSALHNFGRPLSQLERTATIIGGVDNDVLGLQRPRGQPTPARNNAGLRETSCGKALHVLPPTLRHACRCVTSESFLTRRPPATSSSNFSGTVKLTHQSGAGTGAIDQAHGQQRSIYVGVNAAVVSASCVLIDQNDPTTEHTSWAATVPAWGTRVHTRLSNSPRRDADDASASAKCY